MTAIPASLSQLAAPFAAQIGEAFGMTVGQIGLITSLPSLAMIFTQLFCSYAITKVERKVLLTIGLLMAVLGGVGPVFVNSAVMVLFCRILFGLGVGLFGPIPMTYVAEAPQEMRPKLTARWQFVGAIGGAAVMSLVGPIAQHGWKAVLMLYSIIALFIITSLTAFPTTGPMKKKETEVSEGAPKEKKKIAFEYYAGIATAFLMMFVMVGVTSYMSLYEKKPVWQAASCFPDQH